MERPLVPRDEPPFPLQPHGGTKDRPGGRRQGLALALGHHAGYTSRGYADLALDATGTAYVIGLSVVSELLALLTLGLVRPWGERLPHRVPLLGGRAVRPIAAVVPAYLGAAALTALWTPMLLWWHVPHTDMTPAGTALVGLLYLPLVAWGPLLAALAASYHRRRRGAHRPDPRTVVAGGPGAGSNRPSCPAG